LVYGSSGNVLNPNGVSPGAGWTGLSQNNWYRESTVFNQTTNQIISLSITDLTTNITSTVSPSGWYMLGGLGSQYGANAIRFSGMGPNNAQLIDNVSLDSPDAAPEPASLFLGGMGLVVMAALGRRKGIL
jgi:hypothetical protein